MITLSRERKCEGDRECISGEEGDVRVYRGQGFLEKGRKVGENMGDIYGGKVGDGGHDWFKVCRENMWEWMGKWERSRSNLGPGMKEKEIYGIRSFLRWSMRWFYMLQQKRYLLKFKKSWICFI